MGTAAGNGMGREASPKQVCKFRVDGRRWREVPDCASEQEPYERFCLSLLLRAAV
jgi:hypothetical protein